MDAALIEAAARRAVREELGTLRDLVRRLEELRREIEALGRRVRDLESRPSVAEPPPHRED